MNRPKLIAIIRSILDEKMALPQIAQFSEHARLNEQLCLDSVHVLELLVHLELEHGLVLPEEVMMQKQLGTVGSFADFLLQQATRSGSADAGSAR